MKRTRLAALAAVLALSAAAHADIMTYEGLGLTAKATIHAPGSFVDGHTIPLGQYLLTYGNKPYTGYCVDVYQFVGDMEATELGLDTLNRPGAFIGEQVAWLYDSYAASVSDGTSAAGLAAAIWELIFETAGNDPDPAAGDFYISGNDAVVDDAADKQADLPERYETGTEFVILHSDTKQDMLVAGVPEPAALILLAIGGTIQLVRRRRR